MSVRERPGDREYARRIRPVQPGYSIGAAGRTGTIGLVVRDRAGDPQLLSSSHVLNRRPNAYPWPVYQPGGRQRNAADGALAYTSVYVRLSGNRPNRTEAALARPVDATQIDPQHPLGTLTGTTRRLLPGMKLVKIGRTTGIVSGRVVKTSWHGLVRVGRTVNPFTGQVLIEDRRPVSLDGDSGSLWITENGEIAALNFASLDRGRVSIATPIHVVLKRLGVEPLFEVQASSPPAP